MGNVRVATHRFAVSFVEVHEDVVGAVRTVLFVEVIQDGAFRYK